MARDRTPLPPTAVAEASREITLLGLGACPSLVIRRVDAQRVVMDDGTPKRNALGMSEITDGGVPGGADYTLALVSDTPEGVASLIAHEVDGMAWLLTRRDTVLSLPARDPEAVRAEAEHLVRAGASLGPAMGRLADAVQEQWESAVVAGEDTPVRVLFGPTIPVNVAAALKALAAAEVPS